MLRPHERHDKKLNMLSGLAATAPQGRIADAPSDDGGAPVRGALKNGAVARSRS
jgi:hypothetical protein